MNSIDRSTGTAPIQPTVKAEPVIRGVDVQSVRYVESKHQLEVRWTARTQQEGLTATVATKHGYFIELTLSSQPGTLSKGANGEITLGASLPALQNKTDSIALPKGGPNGFNLKVFNDGQLIFEHTRPPMNGG